jgi:hypothetical protein
MMDQYRLKRFGADNQEEEDQTGGQLKKHKPLTKLSEQTVQNIKSIEAQVKGRSGPQDESARDKKPDIKEYLNDE